MLQIFQLSPSSKYLSTLAKLWTALKSGVSLENESFHFALSKNPQIILFGLGLGVHKDTKMQTARVARLCFFTPSVVFFFCFFFFFAFFFVLLLLLLFLIRGLPLPWQSSFLNPLIALIVTPEICFKMYNACANPVDGGVFVGDMQIWGPFIALSVIFFVFSRTFFRSAVNLFRVQQNMIA